MKGLHITGDLFDCRCLVSVLTSEAALRTTCLRITCDAGLTVVEDRFYQFPTVDNAPSGVTGTVLLAESHLCIHTWPEQMAVTLDVYVCNFTRDNSDRAQQLFHDLVAMFKPAVTIDNRILRGVPKSVDNSLNIW